MVKQSFATTFAFVLVVACSSTDDEQNVPVDSGADVAAETGTDGAEEASADAPSEDSPSGDASACAVPLPTGACTENDLHCTSSDKACPGEQYSCSGGTWQKDDLNASCKMLGHDFAYGCVFDSVVGGVLLVCGNCDAGADACAP